MHDHQPASEALSEGIEGHRRQANVMGDNRQPQRFWALLFPRWPLVRSGLVWSGLVCANQPLVSSLFGGEIHSENLGARTGRMCSWTVQVFVVSASGCVGWVGTLSSCLIMYSWFCMVSCKISLVSVSGLWLFRIFRCNVMFELIFLELY